MVPLGWGVGGGLAGLEWGALAWLAGKGWGGWGSWRVLLRAVLLLGGLIPWVGLGLLTVLG